MSAPRGIPGLESHHRDTYMPELPASCLGSNYVYRRHSRMRSLMWTVVATLVMAATGVSAAAL